MNSRRRQWIALAIGVLALLLCALLGRSEPHQALLSYLFAFVFFTGLSAGSLALLMTHTLTGGAWGDDLRAPLLAASRVLPLLALLALPLLLGVRELYPWADNETLSQDALLRARRWYLNPAFFIARTVLYFALWNLLLPFAARGTPRSAAIGLILYALSTLFAATDWAMSLQPHWRSTTFGLLIATGWLLSATALAVLCAPLGTEAMTPHRRQDLGNLLLLLILAWAYLAFMDYLTIWSGDLPAETAWYIPRTLTSWRWLAWFLIVFHFALPFAMLLSRQIKRNPLALRRIAALLLIAGLCNASWLVVPGSRPWGFSARWTDGFAPLGIGALWLCVFLHHGNGRDGASRRRTAAPSAPNEASAQTAPTITAIARGARFSGGFDDTSTHGGEGAGDRD